MKQLVMEARTAERAAERALPDGYFYESFDGSPRDIADWKAITMEPPALARDYDTCYREDIEHYPDCIPTRDVHFISDASGARVATITTITHADGSGYVHMVKALARAQGLGLGHSMARYALRIFAERGVERVVLTTDDFRLSAIKTYLDAGFRPVILHDPESDMNARWDSVLNTLNYADVPRIVRLAGGESV
jgi:mycothiol synthase